MAKVSVVIPIYGVEKYIGRCARSLFNQTLDDVEYIFVDDASQDQSVDILNSIISEYPDRKEQIIIERFKVNKGLTSARCRGVELASGDYIIHCDSDDWLETTMLQKLYEKAIDEDSDIVVCGYKETDGEKIIRHSLHHFIDNREYISNMLSMKETWAIWDKLCKRELYSVFDFPKYSMGEDMFMTFQLVLKANKISIISEELYNYFYNEASMTKVQTEEQKYNNWTQSVYNTECVFTFLAKEYKDQEYAYAIEYLKYKQKKLAGDLAYKSKYAREWLNTFSSTHTSFYKLKGITTLDKLKYLVLILWSWINSWNICSNV